MKKVTFVIVAATICMSSNAFAGGVAGPTLMTDAQMERIVAGWHIGNQHGDELFDTYNGYYEIIAGEANERYGDNVDLPAVVTFEMGPCNGVDGGGLVILAVPTCY